MKKPRRLLLTAAAFALLAVAPASAQFNLMSNSSTPQTLASGTGTINPGVSLTVSGASIAVSVTGNSTLDNFGTISQTGTARAIRLNTNNVSLTVDNGSATNSAASVQAVGDDAFQVNQANDSVILNNYGTFNSTGGQAIDWAAITTGSNTLNNFSTGSLTATGSDAVRPGVNGIIGNAGTIRATPTQSGGVASGSDGIDAQTNSGVQVTNSGTISGRHGITGGITVPTNGTPAPTFAISVTNNNGGVISGVNGSGINIDGVSTTVTTTVNNNAGATMTGDWDGVSTSGDGDGIDVDGVLTLDNAGAIRGLGANGNGSDGFANQPDGVAAGGGTIINRAGGLIYAAATHGSATESHGILIDNSSMGNAIAATTVINSGTIQSVNGYAIRFISTFANTITNNAGGLITGSGPSAAIQSGNGDDTITNAGTITGSGGLAIDLEGGNDTLNVLGGSAAINGNVSGGAGTNTLNISPGTGNAFSYSGAFSNFTTVGIGVSQVGLNGTANVSGGRVVLSGNNTYTGTTTIYNGATLVANTPIAVGSATGSGAVNVLSGGTLAGIGNVAGPVTLFANGSIAPGDNGAGTLTVGGSLNTVGGSTFTFDVGNTQLRTDRLTLGGAFAFTGSGQMVFNIVSNGIDTGTYELIDFSNASGLTTANLAFGTVPTGFVGNFTLTGTQLLLNVTAVPEPGTAAWIGAAAILVTIAAVRRRRAEA